LTKISNSAFAGCTGLTSVTLPSTLKFIEEASFIDCYRLAEVINRSPLTVELGSSEMGGVAAHALAIHDGESRVIEWNGCLFLDEGDSFVLIHYIGNETVLHLPEQLLGKSYRIGAWAFFDCRDVVEITIPDTVTDIGDYAFYRCTSLARIKLPEGIKRLGTYLLRVCQGLVELTVPYGVNEIGDYAMAGCRSLTRIVISKTVRHMGKYALYGCRSLNEIRYKATVEMWEMMEKGGYWYFGIATRQVVCSTGTIDLN
jgi:hypothetical protein